MDSIGLKIGATKEDLSPWYKVDRAHLRKLGFPSGLLLHYGSSLYALLRTVYSEHDWVPWKFAILPQNVASEPEIVERALRYVEKERQMKGPEEWYQVSLPVLRELGVAQIFAKVGGLSAILKNYRPSIFWDDDRFIGIRISGERALGSYLRKLWPSPSIVHNYEIGEGLRVTYYLPHLRLAFEYQGARLYNLAQKDGKASLTVLEDPSKVAAASLHQIRIIFVPFWWDRTLESLVATIIEQGLSADDSKELEGLALPIGSAGLPIARTVTVNFSTSRKIVTISKE